MKRPAFCAVLCLAVLALHVGDRKAGEFPRTGAFPNTKMKNLLTNGEMIPSGTMVFILNRVVFIDDLRAYSVPLTT